MSTVATPRAVTDPGFPDPRAHQVSARRRLGATVRSLGVPDVLALAFVAVLILAVSVPGLLAPQGSLAVDDAVALKSPSAAHWFGTDYLGRDLYSRVVHGTSASLSASAVAVGVGLAGGLVLGVLAGYLGGWVDSVISRFIDVLLSVPGLLLSMVIVVALGFGAVNAAIAVGVSSVAGFARITRAEVLRVRSSSFVEAAQHQGSSRTRTLLHHVLPNSVGSVMALIPLQLGGSIIWISSLSFLGFGAVPPNPEWGLLVSEGQQYFLSAPWLLLFPGATIVVSVLSFSHLQSTWERLRKVHA